jgi:hypothetical protein
MKNKKVLIYNRVSDLGKTLSQEDALVNFAREKGYLLLDKKYWAKFDFTITY